MSADMSDVVDEQVAPVRLGGAHGLGAADDLHDLGGDGVLAGPVHGPAVACMMRSSALSVADFMARCWAARNDAAPSSSAAYSRASA